MPIFVLPTTKGYKHPAMLEIGCLKNTISEGKPKGSPLCAFRGVNILVTLYALYYPIRSAQRRINGIE